MYDLLIIGTGPAGLGAAVYTSRAGLKTAVFGIPEKSHLYMSHNIANYLGFPKGKSGPELMDLCRKHCAEYGTEYFDKEIVNIEKTEEGFTVRDDSTNEYSGKILVISTGLNYAKSGIKGEDEYVGKGVSYCATCDGFFFKDKKVCVIGNGNYAADEAIGLTSFTKDITILSHGKEFEINDEHMKILKANNVSLVKTEKLASFSGDKKVDHVQDKQDNKYEFDAYFLAIGTAGASGFAKSLGLELDGSFIKVDKNGKTNVDGIYACGDCTGTDPQMAISVGDGCRVAMDAIKKLKGVNNYVQY